MKGPTKIIKIRRMKKRMTLRRRKKMIKSERLKLRKKREIKQEEDRINQ